MESEWRYNVAWMGIDPWENGLAARLLDPHDRWVSADTRFPGHLRIWTWDPDSHLFPSLIGAGYVPGGRFPYGLAVEPDNI